MTGLSAGDLQRIEALEAQVEGLSSLVLAMSDLIMGMSKLDDRLITQHGVIVDLLGDVSKRVYRAEDAKSGTAEH